MHAKPIFSDKRGARIGVSKADTGLNFNASDLPFAVKLREAATILSDI